MASFGDNTGLSSRHNNRGRNAAQGQWNSHVQILPDALPGAVAALLLLGIAQPRAMSAPQERVAIAVIDFDYLDTAGEPRDQTGEHRARLNDFMTRMRSGLSAGENYRVVSIECPAVPCTAGQMAPSELIAAAKRAGARLILYGGITR